tara:strand:+ start:1352 stop:1594 length:243 start_codon:yes stop_codon:yes gene_type:complete
VRKKSKLYQEIVEAAKIADDSIVFFWQKMIDLDEEQQDALRNNDNERFKKAEKAKNKLLWRIEWEENEIKNLEKKLKKLD